jgi:hypothetical protein
LSTATAKDFAAIVKDIEAKAIIKLSPRTFKQYIDVEQRNYSLVIELTSLGGHFHCPNCRYATTKQRLYDAIFFLSNILFALCSRAFSIARAHTVKCIMISS